MSLKVWLLCLCQGFLSIHYDKFCSQTHTGKDIASRHDTLEQHYSVAFQYTQL